VSARSGRSARTSRSGRTSASLEPPSAEEAAGAEALPLRHPAVLGFAAFVAVCVALSVTYRIYDPDVWQHLAVGRALWMLHHVPTTQIWIWPTYGAPEVTPSWAFRALLWPFWSAGGVWGLFAWRWLTTLAAFGILWATARRMGARGLGSLVVIVLCALTWRHRSQVRPETLVGVLLALELWVLEGRRLSRPDRAWLIVPIALVWSNVHLSYPLGFAVLGAYLIDAHLRVRRVARAVRDGGEVPPALGLPGPLWMAALLALAALFLNPSGWRALWQPFEYALVWSREPIYRTIAELRPMSWSAHWKTGIELLLVGWPLLLWLRARRVRAVDWAEVLLCALLTALAIQSQRFAGFYALVAAPFVSRDLADRLGVWRIPRWLRPPAPRVGFAAAACLALGALEWARPEMPLGVGFDLTQYPIAACDFIEAHRLRGRLFNEYYNGGYLLWRFWPDRARLPFMDIHQSGTPEDRKLYPYVFVDGQAWQRLDQRYRFDLLLIDGQQHAVEGDRLPDIADADSSFALIFRDDNACLYARRDGACAAAAESLAFGLAPGGNARLERLGAACATDPVLRRLVQAELERQLASSPFNARAHSLLANFALMDRRPDVARQHLAAALAKNPYTYAAHERLGVIALGAGDAKAALHEFERERRSGGGSDALDLYQGRAWERLGDRDKARAAYRRRLARFPGDAAATRALEALERGGKSGP
jgi:hypothetical protein